MPDEDVGLELWRPGVESKLDLCERCAYNSSLNKRQPICSPNKESPCQTAARLESDTSTCPHPDAEYAARWRIAATAVPDEPCTQVHPVWGVKPPEHAIEFSEEFADDDTLIGRVVQPKSASAKATTGVLSPPSPPSTAMQHPSAKVMTDIHRLKIYQNSLKNFAQGMPAKERIQKPRIPLTVFSYPMPETGGIIIMAFKPPSMGMHGFIYGKLTLNVEVPLFHLTGGHVAARRRGVMTKLHEYVFNTLGAERIRVGGDRITPEKFFMSAVGYKPDSESDAQIKILLKADFQDYLNARKREPI